MPLGVLALVLSTAACSDDAAGEGDESETGAEQQGDDIDYGLGVLPALGDHDLVLADFAVGPGE